MLFSTKDYLNGFISGSKDAVRCFLNMRSDDYKKLLTGESWLDYSDISFEYKKGYRAGYKEYYEMLKGVL